MKLEITELHKALNKAYFKQSLKRENIELFKTNLIQLFKRINDSESEEHNKNIVADFLKDTYYKNNYEINTSGRKDLVIHNGKLSSSPVNVIIEAKKPTKKADMISANKPNAKALHELVHYFMQERFIKNNIEIKNLIITDIYQWYIFDATEFERVFITNKQFVKNYNDWYNGVLPDTTTDWFYQKIAKQYIDAEIQTIECSYFDLHEYSDIIKNNDSNEDTKLINLYKLLSPEHLLKLPFANESNILNKDFYNELLHILGLFEQKKGNNKTIERLPEKNRNEGSLIENTISILKTYDKLSNIENLENYGNSIDEQLFSISLELCITWLNRILFLKLLEGQLIKYNKGNQDFAFLSLKMIKDFGDLSELFFDVLAVKTSERSANNKIKYSKIPYLNSSLFEQSELERQTIYINQLKHKLEIPIYSSTVLKKYGSGDKLSGNKITLDYLFEFLNSYNFASESKAQIQEQNKNIISASVLGLIFEKINGYKDGSYFTPGFITMYMCKETIRKAILDKFNFTYNWNCSTINELYNQISKSKIKEYNELINSLRICDPSVGSGHFLVSVLNEIIAVKSELGILIDNEGKTLRDYHITVEDDDLLIIYENEQFQYNPKNKESQRVQETIFYEKQTIIENCLFGVDINQKSVHICRLRLWIELLKHSFYIIPNVEVRHALPLHLELETLPNIDINIKCGNSLISRFSLNGVGYTNGQAKKMQLITSKYKDQVIIYKSTTDKATRKKAEREIASIKEQFASSANPTDEDYKKLRQKQAELGQTPLLFNLDEKTQWEIKVQRLSKEVAELEAAYNEKLKTIYGNAFEWRFEFPEVLNNEGNFVGFDVIIGNPPYISNKEMHLKGMQQFINVYNKTYFSSKSGNYDIYIPFIERSISLLKPNAEISFIIPNKFIIAKYSTALLNLINSNYLFKNFTDLSNISVFEEASVYPIIIRILKQKNSLNNGITEKISCQLNLEKKLLVEKSENWNFSSHSLEYDTNSINGQITKKIETIETINNDLEFSPGINGFQFTNYGKCITEGKISTDSKRIVVTGTIDRYVILHSKTRYKGQDYLHPYIHYDKELISERKWNLFSTPKIVVAGMTKKIEAAFDEKGDLAPGVSVYSIISEVNTLKYILGLINSKLINWYFNIRFQDKHLAGGYISINTTLLAKIPFVKTDTKNKEKIISLVDEILQKKTTDINSITENIEKKIDQIVYKLYALTDEEIKTIEEKG